MKRFRDQEVRRREMVRKQLAARGIADERVLAAMREVPRHRFVADHLVSSAYGDHALPLGQTGQTISQPYVVARMSELLAVDPEHSVLEIGSGSGYQTAILSRLARKVYSLERVDELAKEAIRRMRELGLGNVKIQTFDGTVGWGEFAPYDRILVTAGAPELPKPLLDQLGAPGRLVIPEGSRRGQRLVVYDKHADGTVERHEGEMVVFVPLIGRHGWQD
ncbi:MAG TPA: protein-L-isoaspartate(D-aspartate) O-methyltransferase [Thermoanaerobaculia bacterium]|nr:protein-L-isoaspartate(D-aspartate) O-methyltransferase [Thermoanaerobaculia bacterium]